MEEVLFGEIPRKRHRGESTPFVLAGKHRAAVGTQTCTERVAVEKGIAQTTHEREQRGAVGIGSCAAVGNRRGSTEVVVAKLIGGKTFDERPKSTGVALLIFGQQGGREMMCAPHVIKFQLCVAQP